MCRDRCKRGNVETYMCSSQHGLAPGKAGRSCRTVMRANRAAWGARMSAARCGHQWLDVCACKRPRGCVTLPIGTGVRSVGSGSAGPVLVIPAAAQLAQPQRGTTPKGSPRRTPRDAPGTPRPPSNARRDRPAAASSACFLFLLSIRAASGERTARAKGNGCARHTHGSEAIGCWWL